MKKFMLAAVLATAIGCNGYDDYELRNRVDELEDKVEAHEQWLKQLDASIKSLNDANSAFTALINGGLVTDVKLVSDGSRTGYEFTVTTGSSSSSYTIWNGEKGDQGEAPELGVVLDEDGRYYWTLNGKPLTDENGNKIYASGYKGEQGEQGEDGAPGAPGQAGPQGAQGWTPRLKVDKNPANEGTEDEDALYWWLGYDKNNDGLIKEEDGEEWECLGVEANDVTGTASGLDMTYDEQNKQVTFTKNGVVIGTFDVYFGSSISVSFTVDGEAVAEYSSVSIGNGETVDIEVNVKGAGENAIVKAELLNPGYGYDILVNDNTVKVTAKTAGISNKLLVEVLDGANSYYTWLGLDPIFTATITVAEVDDYGYMPVAFGAGYEAIDNVPVKPTVILTLDAPATRDITFSVFSEEDWGLTDYITFSETVTLTKGETSVVIPCEIPSRADLICDSGLYINASADGIEVEGAELSIANNFNIKLAMTASNYECPFDGSASGEGQGLAALCDANGSTILGTCYWNIDEFDTFADEIAVYGVYVDVTLPAGVANVQFKYQNRAGLNGQPRELNIGAELDGVWTSIATKTDGFNTENSAWNETGKINVGGVSDKFRFGVTKSQTQQANDLTTNPAGSMTLAELDVWVMY